MLKRLKALSPFLLAILSLDRTLCWYILEELGYVNIMGSLDMTGQANGTLTAVSILTAMIDLKVCPEATKPFFTMLDNLLPDLEKPALQKGMRNPVVLAGNPGCLAHVWIYVHGHVQMLFWHY